MESCKYQKIKHLLFGMFSCYKINYNKFLVFMFSVLCACIELKALHSCILRFGLTIVLQTYVNLQIKN